MRPRAAKSTVRIEIYAAGRDAVGLIMLIVVEFPARRIYSSLLLPRAREKHYPEAVIRAKSNCVGERLRERDGNPLGRWRDMWTNKLTSSLMVRAFGRSMPLLDYRCPRVRAFSQSNGTTVEITKRSFFGSIKYSEGQRAWFLHSKFLFIPMMKLQP